MVNWNNLNRTDSDITKESKPLIKAVTVSLRDLKSEKIDQFELMKAKERIRKATERDRRKFLKRLK